MTPDSVYQKHPDVVTRRIAGETMLVPIGATSADCPRIIVLNPVAELIWELLDGKQNIKKINDRVHSSFDVDKKQAVEDIQEFITQLKEQSLITEISRNS